MIRLATVDDAPSIAEAHVASWQAAYVGQLPDDLLDGLTAEARIPGWVTVLSSPPPTAVHIAVQGPLVLGFASSTPSRDDDAESGRTGEVQGIYTRREAWDTGVGAQLMGAALENLTGAGFVEATLWVLATNARAIRFYERGGWSDDGGRRHRAISGHPVDERRYRRAL